MRPAPPPPHRACTDSLPPRRSVIPGVHDFIRLVPVRPPPLSLLRPHLVSHLADELWVLLQGTPLAHGAIFSRQPLKAKEWIAEIAFRVHGPPATGLAQMDENGHQKRLHKGGRGLAFWATKVRPLLPPRRGRSATRRADPWLSPSQSGLPGPVTISSDPSAKVSPPPPAVPEPRSATDADVSLFGGRTSFDGLGVIFDSAPTAPVWRRSDPRNLIGDAEHETWGVGATGVVSGVIDDATQKWLDSERGSGPEGEEEAAYLDKAFGECEAAFRNAQGLLWARIAHFNHTVRVRRPLSIPSLPSLPSCSLLTPLSLPRRSTST